MPRRAVRKILVTWRCYFHFFDQIKKFPKIIIFRNASFFYLKFLRNCLLRKSFLGKRFSFSAKVPFKLPFLMSVKGTDFRTVFCSDVMVSQYIREAYEHKERKGHPRMV